MIVIAAGHPGREPLRRALRHRRRGHGAALDDRPDRRPRRVRPGDRQRRRDRRDGGPARVACAGSPTSSTRSATRRRRSRRATRSARRRSRRSSCSTPTRPGSRDQAGGALGTNFELVRPVGRRGPLHRRPDAVPVRLARDAGGRTRRRRGRPGGAPPVPRAPRDHGRHRAAGVRAGDRHRHRLGDQVDARCRR